MVERISFHQEISRNKFKSVLLIISIFLVFLLLGFVISMVYDPSIMFIIMIFSIIISMIYILISYYNSDKIALSSVGAKPASVNNALHRQFIHSVENMAIASGLPKPRAYVMESRQINAFASGRDPKHAVICVTTGAIEKLTKQELEGVISHEMAHIANYDIRFMTLTAVMIGMIAIISEIFLRSLWFSSGSKKEGDKAEIIFLIIGIVLAILAPLATQLVSLAISRKREFAADATGVKFTRYSPGLKLALEKIKKDYSNSYSEDNHKYSKAIAPLFISDPMKKKIKGLFSTHPDMDERISRLSKM